MSVGERAVIVAICVASIAFLIAYVVRSYRPGGFGPMPRVLPFTRRGRMRMNTTWDEHGWAKPFDDDGNLLPRRERKVAKEK